MEKVERKLHNPKSHAPAVYIPCWLIQVPSALLSYAAKIVYGRLSQWSTTKGTVHRSLDQLSQEIGMNPRSLERILKELKQVGLIGTYQAELGGVNHYQFYDHEWMYAPINEHLIYHESYPQADPAKVVPPRNSAGTPPANLRVPPRNSAGPKIEEIKENKSKSFLYVNDQKKHSHGNEDIDEQKLPIVYENEKRHDWAQMKNEQASIERNKEFKRTSGVPDNIMQMLKGVRRAK